MNDNVLVILLAIGVLLVNGTVLRHYYRNGKLLSLAGGVHVNVLCCLVIGPIFYALYPAAYDTERVQQSVVVENALLAYLLFLVGYLVNAVTELRNTLRVHNKEILPRLKSLSGLQVLLLFLMASMGIVASLFSINTSGLGTVFNIFALFLFPIVTLSVVRFDWRRPDTWFGPLLINGLVGFYCITSSWRSLAVIYVISLIIGATMRVKLSTKSLALLLLACLGWYIWLFPFLQLKKSRASENVPLWSLFIESQEMPLELRFQEGFVFLGLRLNSVREIGFVENGLTQGRTELRKGESYKEAALQLIPRVVWPSKPSYNTMMNYTLPREIGLIGWEDPDTSSGVSLWPEAVWNLTRWSLPLFVPVVFWILRRVDYVVLNLRIDKFFRWWTFSCLFYLSVQILSLVTFVTMVLWTIVTLYIYSRFFAVIVSGERHA